MLFNSVIFIMIFLPLAVAGWFLLQKLDNPVYSKIFLIGMSFWFYGYYNVYYLFILLISLVINYLCSGLFQKTTTSKCRKLILFSGLFANIGILFYFKYFNFFIENCNFFFHTNFQLEAIALPLGISFFTFQQISFLVDRYKNESPHYSLADYSCFITYFPQLIAGPIVLHNEFVPQLHARKNRRFNIDNFFDGFSLFILGLGKKVLLADVLALVVNAEYKTIPYYLDIISGWVIIICYILELYFDFSGYCDMARGIGKIFGFHLPENFDSPLRATSIKDFWRRWHMTLSRFLSNYIYIPLGGNRKGIAAKCRNLLVVFLISGIWHGANWTFIVWGLLHGAAMVWETLFPKLRFSSERLNRIFTFLYVTMTFSVFRSNSLTQAWGLLKRLFAGGWNGLLIEKGNALQIPELHVIHKLLSMKLPQWQQPFNLICLLILLTVCFLLLRGKKAEIWIADHGRSTKGLFILATIFTWSLISLSQVSTFLYFNF